MIERIGTVSLFVQDQQRAKVFYTEKVGFELRRDAPLYPGAETRWIAVAPQGSETELILYPIDSNWQHYAGVIGKAQAMTFSVPDLAETYATLLDRGVEFTHEPKTEPWGTFTTMIDSEGNKVLVVQST